MKLPNHHQMMVEDGFPVELLLTQEQRAAIWKANPPKQLHRNFNGGTMSQDQLATATEILKKKRTKPNFKGLSLEELKGEYDKRVLALKDNWGVDFAPLPLASIAEGEEACVAVENAVRKQMKLEVDRNYQKRKREEAAKAKAGAVTPTPTEAQTEEDTMSRKKSTRKASKARTSAASANSHRGANDDAKITVLAKENPKRPNTEQHRRFAQLMRFGGKTVGDYKKAGGLMITLRHAEDIKTVKVS